VNADRTKAEPHDPAAPEPDVLNQLRSCLQALEKAGLEVLVVDVTLPEIADAGLSVVRVIIPGMIPLTHGQQHRCQGGRRLYRTPQLMGYVDRETTEDELNPIPHPFP
jgi:ribosomal protein S12 methylthiotransferase accessory factor